MTNRGLTGVAGEYYVAGFWCNNIGKPTQSAFRQTCCNTAPFQIARMT